MNRSPRGRENFYLEMESARNDTQAEMYHDVVGAISSKPKSSEKILLGGDERQTGTTESAIQVLNYALHSQAAVVRRLLCISVAVVTVAFLTAAATLVLALFLMLHGTNNMAVSSNNDDPLQESKLSRSKFETDLKAVKQNISTIQSRAADKAFAGELEKLKAKISEIGEKVTNLDKGNISDNVQKQDEAKLDLRIVKSVNATVTGKLRDVQQDITRLEQMVIKISKDPGPRGPRGFNGTNGLPGRPGYSNWTLCSYNHQASAGVSPSVYANQEVQITEPNGKKFLGVTCDTNDAKFVRMTSTTSKYSINYKCTCTETLRSGFSKMYCYLHYWECPT